MEEKLTPPILLFDSECPLCVRFKDSLTMLEGTEIITAVSIHDDEVYKQLPYLNKEECMLKVHYITSDNQVLVGEEAIEHLIKLFPLVHKFSWLIESNMGKKAVDYFHSMTNKYRKTLIKKCPSCTK
ncbi:thiol-disulfide oxidoreductase DCC family protein [Bacteriovorax sp. DB6_IX]|uniref:thiol-disulfide oxidoreductase DCC family protein n=1 Tax=Bacteriovorax sp. DB6_IX TaxID=1353530 RepID=UPI000389FC5A|nr:DCC1-like thiol-disulfide oxidoreductase family protein [Bacteriovorax sp. DB6_IX]EQC50768.1 PF04134 family protein [Bacteriovorax sp. DB6_IX]